MFSYVKTPQNTHFLCKNTHFIPKNTHFICKITSKHRIYTQNHLKNPIFPIKTPIFAPQIPAGPRFRLHFRLLLPAAPVYPRHALVGHHHAFHRICDEFHGADGGGGAQWAGFGDYRCVFDHFYGVFKQIQVFFDRKI
jgi:hypothetical protein